MRNLEQENTHPSYLQQQEAMQLNLDTANRIVFILK